MSVGPGRTAVSDLPAHSCSAVGICERGTWGSGLTGPALGPSSEVGFRLRKCMFDAHGDGRLKLERTQLLGDHPTQIGRLIAPDESSADDSGSKTYGKLLAYFTVRVLDDVLRVAVDPNQRRRLDVQAGLLLNLPHDALADRLADLHGSAR